MDQNFLVTFDETTGGIRSLVNKTDKYAMNWVEGASVWGTVKGAEIVSVTPVKDGIDAVYQTDYFTVSVSRRLTEGVLKERYVLKNRICADVFLLRGAFGIYLTFNDSYAEAATCLTKRCHTHIWCGLNSSYVQAIKMGPCPFGLGLVLTEGSFDTYSVERDLKEQSNDRGDFLFHPEPIVLRPGEETVLAWDLFWFPDGHFNEALAQYENIITVDAENYTVFAAEPIRFSVSKPDAKITLGGALLPAKTENGRTVIEYLPSRTGEHIFMIEADGRRTKAEFFVQIPFRELVKQRVKFIVRHQQYHDPQSALDGAYLIYDNEDHCPVFDYVDRDRNASRERLVMGLLVAKYLQYEADPEVYDSLMHYYRFVSREFFDEESAEVYDTIGKSPQFKRLYNAPWMSVFMLEMYNVTKDTTYLTHMVRLLKRYYEIGGDTFYPNGLSLFESVEALKKAGMTAEADELAALFRRHADNIAQKGADYPAIEVRYEQTIVTPAATIMAQMAQIDGGTGYVSECQKHIAILERFNGHQPSHHLYEVALRHWDAYWFGKRKNYGDTMPHAASVHSSNAFLHYGWLSGNDAYIRKAHMGARNCLSLFHADGSASMAYVYPYKINGVRGEYYDEFANEQDGFLYYMMKFYGYMGAPKQ